MLSFSSRSTILLALLVLLAATRVSTSQEDSQANTIYDVLKLNGLPIGLLPKGVSNFSIDEQGRFQVYLDRACNAKFEDQVHYERNITGNLTYGQIGALSGVSAQELFLWLPVKGIRVDIPSSGLIYFDVGVIHKQFSLSLFETPPDCQAADQFNGDDLLEGKRVADVVLQSKMATPRGTYDRRVQAAVM
ncbi:uncharacterized protein LOC116249621 [Nymphaea colorata]|nr:uncharacterized protein LOC116249621 [Nymphaea colorata]